MDKASLQKKTVAELREHAKKLPDAKGLSGMKKDELVEFILSHGGDAPASGPAPTGKATAPSDKSELKRLIRQLKADKADALSRQDRARAGECNRLIHQYKRMLRRMARAVG